VPWRAAIDGDHKGLVERGQAMAARHGTWGEAIARQMAVYESMLGRYAGETAGRSA